MTDIIIGFLNMIGGLIVNVFPSFSSDSSVNGVIANAIITVLDFVADSNFLVPINTILIILGIIIGYRIIMFSIFTVNWIIKRIRGG